MRKLTSTAAAGVQAVIDRNIEVLRHIPNALAAEPGFPIVGGKLLREPAIILYVDRKLSPAQLLPEDIAPEAIEGVRVDVVAADPWTQLALNPATQALAVELDAAAAATTPYVGIDGDPIDAAFNIEKPILCAAGPDVGWKVLEQFLAATRTTLTVAMYDFSAIWVANALINVTRDEDVQVALTIDNGLADKEKDIQTLLADKLGDSYDSEIIICRKTSRFPTAYHEKVAVQDHKRFWLSSGNWSPNSQPETDPIGVPIGGWFSRGNREWHVVVEDAPLAKMFERYILHDKTESESDAALAGEDRIAFPDLFVPLEALLEPQSAALAASGPVKAERLPVAGGAVRVRPLLSPDNYARRVSEWIRGATTSLDMQYSYINYSAKAEDAAYQALLDDLAALSWRDDFQLRIIVASGGMDDVRRLAQAGFNETAFKLQGRIHNKGIVRDGTEVLVSSQNWSGDGFLRNRDAGLIIENAEIAAYFARLFDDDWNTRARDAFESAGLGAVIAPPEAPPPAGMVRMSWADYFGE